VTVRHARIALYWACRRNPLVGAAVLLVVALTQWAGCAALLLAPDEAQPALFAAWVLLVALVASWYVTP
jgi:hypothetical protein